MSESMDLGGHLEAIRQRHDAADLAQQQAGEEVSELRRAILAGDTTTGDSLDDALLCLYGTELLGNPQLADTFHTLNQAIVDHAGEPMLIRVAYTTQEGCTGFGGRGHTVRHHSNMLGSIANNTTGLEVRGSAHGINIGLPLDKIAGVASRQRGAKAESLDSFIIAGLPIGEHGSTLGKRSDVALAHLGLDISQHLMTSGGSEKALHMEHSDEFVHFLIGHDAIQDWLAGFHGSHHFMQFRELYAELGIARLPEAVTPALQHELETASENLRKQVTTVQAELTDLAGQTYEKKRGLTELVSRAKKLGISLTPTATVESVEE